MIDTILSSVSLLTLQAFMPPMLLPAFKKKASYQIERSLRFNAADSPSVYRTFTQNSTSNTKGILSLNVKRASLGATRRVLFYVGVDSAGSSNFFFVEFNTDHTLHIIFNGANTLSGSSTTRYQDPTAHYHIVISFDLSLGSNSVLAWVNGKPVALSGTLPTSTNIQTGAGCIMCIGNYSTAAAGLPFDGLFSDVYWLDGQHDTNAHLLFGQFNSTTNEWELKKYTGGNYGVNGGHWDFSDNSAATSSALGKDRSGNNNDLTFRSISVAAGPDNDSLTDTPTNWGTDTGLGGEVRGNYPTLNPLSSSASISFSNGNLDFSTSGANQRAGTTFAIPTTGKWYGEIVATAAANIVLGVSSMPINLATGTSFPSGMVLYTSFDNSIYVNGSAVQTGLATISNNDVIGWALDSDNNTLQFYKNGSALSASVDISGFTKPMCIVVGTVFSGAAGKCNFGQRPFAHAAPTGFKCLCTQNLTDTTVALPATFTGNASTSGPFIWANGVVETVTINGNVAIEGTHFGRLAGGIKIITSSASYNSAGSNTITTATYGVPFKYARAV